MPSSALDDYLTEVRRIRSTGQGTGEQSYYPAVSNLLNALSATAAPRRAALTHPAGISGSFPDLALYETDSLALVLPAEVKAATGSMAALLTSAQARRYAETFGGGMVLLTNLWEWVLADLQGGALVELERVTLVPSVQDLDAAHPPVVAGAEIRLKGLLNTGCEVRGAARSPKTVASLLAHHARRMRDSITSTGQPGELLKPIREALKKGLEIDLDDDRLVPTVVQTLVYGAFAAWLRADDPMRYRWMHASYTLNVPVFAEVLHGAMSPRLLRECNLPQHLDAIERVLCWTDRDAFTAQFDGDAIQYFYEPFLAEFDADLRDALGIWYTPAEIAAYQVARADHHVRVDLGKPDGLADESVFLLDPAVGTGTYLIAAVDYIYKFHENNGEPRAVAAQRALNAALTRFVGFEILPAAFIICHLHLSRHLMQLGATLPPEQRLRVYLTNSLTGWDSASGPQGLTLFPELEAELANAATAKHTDPVLVVIGNPPYHGYSSAESSEEKAMLRPWAEELTHVWGLRKHRLNDLYVRFWRISIERIATLTGQGVVSFITNRKWLGGRSYPSMRSAIVDSFHEVWVDDLHGDVHDRTHPGDQSVFTTGIAAGIQVGTAIVTGVRTTSAPVAASVHIASYRGTAASKRADLQARHNGAGSMQSGYAAQTPTHASRYRFVADTADDHPSLDEYLPFFRSGVQPVGEAVLDHDRARLDARMRDYFDPSLNLQHVVGLHPAFGKARARYNAAQTRTTLLPGGYDPGKVVQYLFRPFDTRWLYWEPTTKLLTESRRELVPYWSAPAKTQVSLVASQTRRRLGAARLYATHAIAGFDSVDPNARVFPLYTPTAAAIGNEDRGELELTVATSHNADTTVAPEWVAAAKTALGVSDDTDAAEAVFYALLAITHSDDWLALQAVEADDFPTIPIPADAADLAAAADLGRALTALLDPNTDVPGVTTGRIHQHLRHLGLPDQVSGDVAISSGSKGNRAGIRQGSDVFWDETHGWHDVPDAVWEYTIGGFQVLPKWLSYRIDALTPADRETFRILCRRIQASLDLAAGSNALYGSAQINPLTA